MSIIDNYYIKPILCKIALDVVIKNHYLHRKAPCSYSWGLFCKDKLVGCIIYGTPASRSLQKGICGVEEANHVIELTRLWIENITPKNVESYLIGNTLKLLPLNKDIVVSYAEVNAGHVGTIYQATNWIYTGLSDRHIQWQIKNDNGVHSRHLFDKYGGVNKAKEILRDNMISVERPRKHRYIYFRGSKKRRKELKKKLRYPVLPYPKKEN